MSTAWSHPARMHQELVPMQWQSKQEDLVSCAPAYFKLVWKGKSADLGGFVYQEFRKCVCHGTTASDSLTAAKNFVQLLRDIEKFAPPPLPAL